MSHRSKYDEFWLKNIDVLKESVETAYKEGSSSISINGISMYGRRKRSSWYGKIVVCRDGVVKDSVMVHLKSLGRIILDSSLLNGYDSCFSFTVTKDLILVVEKLDYTDSKHIEHDVKHDVVVQTSSGSSLSGESGAGISEPPGRLFRDKPLGPGCRCDHVFQGFSWHELATLKASQLPREPGVYVIRVIKTGEELFDAKSRLEEVILRSRWDELIRYATSRLVRIFRIRECPLIYIGSTDSIRSRFKDLAGIRHTAFFPVLAILLGNWRLDYGFKTVSTKKEAEHLEHELKKKYQEIHGYLPALVEV